MKSSIASSRTIFTTVFINNCAVINKQIIPSFVYILLSSMITGLFTTHSIIKNTQRYINTCDILPFPHNFRREEDPPVT